MAEAHLRANQPPPKSNKASAVRLSMMAGAGALAIGAGFIAQNQLFARGTDPAAEIKVVKGSVEPLVVRDAPRYDQLARREEEKPAEVTIDPSAEARRLARQARERALVEKRAQEAAALASPLTFERNEPRRSTSRVNSGSQAQLAALTGQLAALSNTAPGSAADLGAGRRAANGVAESAGTRLDYSGVVLDKTYLPPASEHLVQAGTLIPAALITGVNSDLPGEIIAQVIEPIFDTPSGNTKLIPAGAKLLGRYDSVIGYGQDRAFIVWDRLLMPNGYSIELDELKGTDKKGQAGVADQVDYHFARLAGAVLLSSFLVVGGNVVENSDGDSFTSDLGDAAAQQAVDIGSTIIDRQLEVQPTITIRPSWTLRVLVNRDIVLAPYNQL